MSRPSPRGRWASVTSKREGRVRRRSPGHHRRAGGCARQEQAHWGAVGRGAAPESLGLGFLRGCIALSVLPARRRVSTCAGRPALGVGLQGRAGPWRGLEADGGQKAGSAEGHGQVCVGSRQSAGLMGLGPLSLWSRELVVNI